MRIAIVTVQVPFIRGGAEIHAEQLEAELSRRGHDAEIVSIPFKWYPPSALVDAMMMGRLMDLSESNGERIDRVIALKFPAYYLCHEQKVIWLLHQHRQAYDLWGTEFGDLHQHPEGEKVRQLITASDTVAFREARRLYANSRNVAERVHHYNHLTATPLYHPPAHHARFHCEEYGDFVFYPSRIDRMKRQRLLVEATRHLRTTTRMVIAGTGASHEFRLLAEMVARHGLEDRVSLLGLVSEERKLSLYASCLAVYCGAVDEDYGYVPLEAMFAEKPVIVHVDAGGPLEFVVDGRNGVIVPADAQALAASIDDLAQDPPRARAMGLEGRAMLAEQRIDWDHVIDCLLDGHG